MSISKFDEVVTSDRVFILYVQRTGTTVDVSVHIDRDAAKAELAAAREIYRNAKLVEYEHRDEVPVW